MFLSLELTSGETAYDDIDEINENIVTLANSKKKNVPDSDYDCDMTDFHIFYSSIHLSSATNRQSSSKKNGCKNSHGIIPSSPQKQQKLKESTNDPPVLRRRDKPQHNDK